MKFKLISLFSGAGGLDLGFVRAGFEIAYANDIDKAVKETYEKNFGHSLDNRDINKVPISELPDADGIIGGPPCQSWSIAGKMRGAEDPRGQLFFRYVEIIDKKSPMFFLAENVAGITYERHRKEFERILKMLESAGKGYEISWKVLNSADYGVPQDRKRVFIVGYRKDLGIKFEFPKPFSKRVTLREAISDLPEPLPAKEKNKTNGNALKVPNHEYMVGKFSTLYMSRNRVRSWDEVSFTIQAGGRHAPIHPQANKMIKVGPDKFIFDPNSPKPYRRLSVRECARIQTFPDNFIFYYTNVSDGYKMVGNAVPVKLAEVLARKIKADLEAALHVKASEKSSPKKETLLAFQ